MVTDGRERADARLQLYDAAADEVAGRVIGRYSSSFGLATRLLAPQYRQHVANVYALVRVADEIVDGAAAEAGLDAAAAGARLDEYERETERAMGTGFSTDLVVHAFGRTARWSGIDASLTAPFFASMRADLSATEHDAESFARYVDGSAEVVGLMCLRVFLRDEPSRSAAETAELERGARALGAAFQKVNFLRDLAADFRILGRSYFPGVDPARFDESVKHALLDDIDADLAISAAAVPRLPAGARRAVGLAQDLYTELAATLRATPAAVLATERISVPRSTKTRLGIRAVLGRSRSATGATAVSTVRGSRA